MKRITIGLIILGVLALSPIGGSAKDEVVKIGHMPLVMSLPTYVAQEKGFFAEEGLKVEIILFKSGTTIVDALVAGRIDADCGSATSTHWFAEQNLSGRFKIFLVYSSVGLKDNTYVVVVKRDAPYKGLEDLVGKRVGVIPGPTGLALSKACLRKKIDPEKVTYVPLPPHNVVAALAAGQIDAFFYPEPPGMMAVSKGVGRYLLKSPCTLLGLKRGIPGGAFSFSAKFLKERPEVAKRLKAAYYKAVDFIKAHEEEARGYLPKYTGLPEPVAMRIPFERWIKIEEFDREAGQQYFDVLYKEGAYKKRIDTTKLYYER